MMIISNADDMLATALDPLSVRATVDSIIAASTAGEKRDAVTELELLALVQLGIAEQTKRFMVDVRALLRTSPSRELARQRVSQGMHAIHAEWREPLHALIPAVRAVTKAKSDWQDADAALVALYRAGWPVREQDQARLADAQKRLRQR